MGISFDICVIQMEELYYHNIEYLDFQYFPVLEEDYMGTSDRPQCEKAPTDDSYSTQVWVPCAKAETQ